MKNTIAWPAGFVIGLGCSLAVLAGPPPFPDEMSYPNVIKPVLQQGTYGSGLKELNDPLDVKILDSKRFLIADTNNARIVVYDSERNYWSAVGEFEGRLRRPVSLSVSAGGDIFVLDAGSLSIVGAKESFDLSRAIGPNVDPAVLDIYGGDFLVTDESNCRLHLISGKSGKLIKSVGSFGEGPGQFKRPHGVTHDNEGNIYVSDSENSRIVKLTSQLDFDTCWGIWGSYSGLLATPSGLSWSDGKLFVADCLNHRIQVFDKAGNFQFQWGRHPVQTHEGHGRVHYPFALHAVENRVAVIEPFENRFQVFAMDNLEKVQQVNDSAWWEKATRFHYGTKAAAAKACYVMVSEPDTHSVLLFALDSESRPVFKGRTGGYGSALGKFKKATGVCFHPTKPIAYASDGGNRRIQMFAIKRDDESIEEVRSKIERSIFDKSDISHGYSLEFIKARDFSQAVMANETVSVGNKTVSTEVPLGFIDAGAMVANSQGNIYLADPTNCRIVKLNESLDPVGVIGGPGKGPGQLQKPLNVALSYDEKVLYVVDAYNFRIQAFDARSGSYLFDFGKSGAENGGFSAPFGVAADKEGNLYVSDTGFHTIQKFDSRGKFISAWGSWGTENGEFYKPKGLAVTPDQKILVLDFGNHRGQIFRGDGTFFTQFGLGEGGKSNALYRAK